MGKHIQISNLKTINNQSLIIDSENNEVTDLRLLPNQYIYTHTNVDYTDDPTEESPIIVSNGIDSDLVRVIGVLFNGILIPNSYYTFNFSDSDKPIEVKINSLPESILALFIHENDVNVVTLFLEKRDTSLDSY